MREYFDLFGLSENATPDELKSAYRRLVKQWHPDQFAHDERRRTAAEAHLKVINRAYRVLKFALQHRWTDLGPVGGGPSPSHPREQAPPVDQFSRPIAALETEPVLTYLPLIFAVVVLKRHSLPFAESVICALAGLLMVAWTMMAWRVWSNQDMSYSRRIAWIVMMILFACAAVPIYFNSRRHAGAA